jgi:uncharacterized repeat protein (TIGR01451 family)
MKGIRPWIVFTAISVLTLIVLVESGGAWIDAVKAVYLPMVLKSVSFGPKPGMNYSVNPTEARSNEDVTYTLIVSNVGQSPVTNVVISDTLSSYLDLRSVTTTKGTYTAGSTLRVWIVNMNSLDPGENETITVVGRVNTTTETATLSNAAQMTYSYANQSYSQTSNPVELQIVLPTPTATATATTPPPATCTDADGDGYAVEGGDCGPVDCNDSNVNVHPGATEVCDNGIDDDCDGAIDNNDPDCVACTDADGDGYAVEGGDCGPVDCNDSNVNVHPGATEVCDNGIDDNCNGLTDAQEPACSNAPNIVVVGWDGTQRDHFFQCYNKQLPECANGLPNIQALSGGTIFNNTITDGATSTKPGWAQIFTGYDADVTGVYDLKIYQPIPLGYTVFEKIEDYFGPENVVTMFISAKGVHTGDACVGEPTYLNGVPVTETLGQPWCITSDYVDYFELNQITDDDLGNRALELLDAHQDDLFFALFLFRTPDVIGHLNGEDSVEYSQAIINDDVWLGEIVAKLQELGIYGNTLVYVVSDHGFDEGKDVHLNAPYDILATNDPLVVRSGDRKDIGPTFLERYGISLGAIGPAPAVNGSSLYHIPDLECIPEGGTFLDYPGAPVCCSGLTLINLDMKIGGCHDATGGVGDDSGFCTACGNSVCESPENPCNCPADCPLY